MHLHSTSRTATEPTNSIMTEKRPTEQRSDPARDTATYTTPVYNKSTDNYSTVVSIPRESSRNSRSEGSSLGLSSGVIISSSIVAVLGVVAIVLILVILVRICRKRLKRRNNVRTVRSNTQLSFGNLSYVGEGRRTSACDTEVDMTDFEVMRSRVVTSIKRKVSIFSGKENQLQDSHRISCGRLSIVETMCENSAMDLGDIVQTYQV